MSPQQLKLKEDIKDLVSSLKSYDDSEEALDKFAHDLSKAIDDYAKSLVIMAYPSDVVIAAMVAGPTPVLAANALRSQVV